MSTRPDGGGIAEIAFAAAILLLAAAGFFAVPHLVSSWTFSMPGTTDAALSPTFFPRVAIVSMGVAAFFVIATAASRGSLPLPIAQLSKFDVRRFVYVLGYVCVYFIAMQIVGFVSASVLFVALVNFMVGYRNGKAIFAVALIMPICVAFTFRHGMQVILPSGIWGIGF